MELKLYLFIKLTNVIMDLLKKFDTQASYDAIKDSLEYPTVSYVTENDLIYFLSKPELYEWVDLGLSVKWAAWNVGATKPEEYGLYFAWGETQGYTGITDDKGFYWGDYEFTTAETGTTDTEFRGGLTKYNNNSSCGIIDNLTVLESSDDAASATQSTCKMPTKANFDELTANTTSAWTSVNGVSGVQFTSKVEGYTDKSIFVPAAGGCGNGSLSGAGSGGGYWSSSLNESNSRNAWNLNFNSDNVNVNNNNRYYGQSVRAVLS